MIVKAQRCIMCGNKNAIEHELYELLIGQSGPFCGDCAVEIVNGLIKETEELVETKEG